MNVLITGGRGPVGSAVVEDCLNDPIVESVVTLGRSEPKAAIASSKVKHLVGSILNRQLIETIFLDYNITHFIHAAGARTKACETDSNLAFEVNTKATATIFEAAARFNKVIAGLFVSSAAVYGQCSQCEIAESHPVAPVSHYAKSKEEAEVAVGQVGDRSSMQTIIVRPGFIPGSSRSKLCQLGKMVRTDDEVTLCFKERFYVHSVDDVAKSLLLLLKGEPECEGLYHLPGHCLELTRFSEYLLELAFEEGYQPQVRIQPDPTMQLPESLSWNRFQEDFPNFREVDAESLVRKIFYCQDSED